MTPTAFDRDQAVRELEKALYKPLDRTWAKVELFLGLLLAGVGLCCDFPPIVRVALFTFGGYLALAGHRSHLYQSNYELVAYLLNEIHRSQTKVEPQ